MFTGKMFTGKTLAGKMLAGKRETGNPALRIRYSVKSLARRQVR